MAIITTQDRVEIYYRDCVIAHDRRGHGRSSQTGDGHDMDHSADDLAALTAHLDLKSVDLLAFIKT